MAVQASVGFGSTVPLNVYHKGQFLHREVHIEDGLMKINGKVIGSKDVIEAFTNFTK